MKKIILMCVVLVLAGCDGKPVNVFDVGAAKERREMEEKWRKVNKPLGDCEYGDRKCLGLELIKQLNESENWGGLSEKPKTKED